MIRQIPIILRQMGPRYVAFRVFHEFRKRSGLLRHAFPTSFAPAAAPPLEQWRKEKPPFLIKAREEVRVSRRQDTELKLWHTRFLSGEFQYFNYEWKPIGIDYDWLTNPTTAYTYALDHWTEIPDLDPEKGDVKYVWEKSRFSYLLQLIRYDYHFDEDQAELVFEEIDRWLDANPLNLGPNYLCSQEISLRLLNWIFALYYYQNSAALTQVRWARIAQSIYGQLKHVRANIHFSRIAVRNNHAITETLMLYVGGLLFPHFPEAEEWKKSGKAWFEEEVTYQIYPDGTYIQHSHNYQRVLTQLLSYALAVTQANGEQFDEAVRERMGLSLGYLEQCTDLNSGELPNYGSNDGALFFPLATQAYRDYRPQLNALGNLLGTGLAYSNASSEEAEWLSTTPVNFERANLEPRSIQSAHDWKGVYTYKREDSFSFVNCGSYQDRPAHADNLHLDLWLSGVNILRDAGTYRYNTDRTKTLFFSGTAGHNTVMLGNNDQMLKAGRFIWLNWSRATKADFNPRETGFSFEGEIEAFGHLDKGIRHQRRITHDTTARTWKIEDHVAHSTGLPVVQHWNLHPDWATYITIEAKGEDGKTISPEMTPGWFSGHYGELSSAPHLTFSTMGKIIKTVITRLD